MRKKLSESEKAERQAQRDAAKRLAALSAEKAQKPVKEISITIEWKRSVMWGFNPHCEARVIYADGSYDCSPTFKCSGSGYDKESTVIADVFNHYLKYKLWQLPIEKLQDRENGLPYGIYCNKESITDSNSSSAYRHYSGGIGTDCYYRIAECIGGKFERISTGKTFDVYKYIDLPAKADANV